MVRLNPLQQLRDLDTTSLQFHKQLSSCLRGSEYQSAIPNLQGEDLAWLVEYLDGVLVSISDPADVAFQEFLHELREICSIKGVLPKSRTFSTNPLLDASLPSASGYVYEGTLDGSKVHIKRVRTFLKGDLQKVKETFYQVAVIWKYLTHPNIISLLGATTDPLQLVSDWMYGGDLTEYITDHPEADRLSLLSGVAEGLNYLHSCNVIHGALKGPNILIDTTGCARITGFGLAMVAENTNSIRSTSAEYGQDVRWIAPEILEDRGTYGREGDVFSFAMVTIETFTAAVPFSDKPPRAALLAIVGGERPPRPADPTLTDRLWDFTQRCWHQEPQLRPQVLQIVRGFSIPAWRRLIDRPLAMEERIALITAIFSDHNEIEVVKGLRGGDAQSFIDVIDETLNALAPELRMRSVQIPLCYNRSDTPLYRGGYADVWKGEHQGRKVAVKVLGIYLTSDFNKITRMFCKEVMTWKTLHHQNVLPLLGVTMSTNEFAMASEWMDNGNVNQFVKVHKDVNRFELLKGISRGLAYMHGEEMVHGDLKGANILIDQDGHARLADFGLTTIASDSTTSSSSIGGGTTRWMSPERLNPDQFCLKDSRPTKESDCYALGMVILEVLSGQLPFKEDSNNYIVMQKVLDGKHPRRPRGAEETWFTDDLWGMLKWCWSHKPKARPAVEAVLEYLEQVSTAWQPLPSSTDGDGRTNTDHDDRSSLTVSGPEGVPPALTVHRSHIEEDITEVCQAERSGLPVLATPQLPSAFIPLTKVVRWDGTSEDINRTLVAAFEAEDYLDCIQNLRAQNIDPLSYIDNLDKIIDRLPASSDLRRRCIRALVGTCGLYGILPTSYIFAGKLSRHGQRSFVSSAAFDVWKLADEDHQDQVFAVKSLRSRDGDPVEKLNEKYCKEVIVSKRISHTNILSIEGVAPAVFQFCMVFQWMERGNILEYVREYPVVDRLELLIGVARGLDHLHTNEIVHGDLKSSNILIDAKGSPRLCDFANCSFTNNTEPLNTMTLNYIRTIRWSAPERLNVRAQEREPTTMSDVYSLAMVIVELVTGKMPFPELTEHAVIVMISKGKRPPKPRDFDAPGITPAVWKIAQKCWHEKAKERPKANAVLQSLEDLVNPDSKHAQAPFFQCWRDVFNG